MNKENRIDEFLEKHGLASAKIDRESLLQTFLSEMENGLQGRPSSLAMIPTFIDPTGSIAPNRRIVVLDAGGTNLRVGVVTFDPHGIPSIDNFAKHAMPGTQSELTKDEFFDHFVDLLLPLADQADTIGFCFSYSADITPDHDARLKYWSKEIKAPEVEGELIGANILTRLADRGHRKKMVILNDTAATLLAARCADSQQRFAAQIGLILGTGTNTAYVEQNARITKRHDLPPASAQIINVESGNFDKAPCGDIDKALDAATDDPGCYRFEKMISGAYRGRLCHDLLKDASAQGLFSASAAKDVDTWPGLSTADVTRYLNTPEGDRPFLGQRFSPRDHRVVRGILGAVALRAAVLTAVNLAAAAIKSCPGGTPTAPLCINADGTTFYAQHGFQAMVVQHLRQLLNPRKLSFEIVRIEDAPFIGAAMAGLIHSE